MHEDDSPAHFDQDHYTVSREQLVTMLEAARSSLDRLARLLNNWERGTAQGTYFEAKDEVLGEAAVARAYLAALVQIVDWLTNSVEPSLDVEVEVRRLGQRFRTQQNRMQALGITSLGY